LFSRVERPTLTVESQLTMPLELASFEKRTGATGSVRLAEKVGKLSRYRGFERKRYRSRQLIGAVVRFAGKEP